MAVLSMQSACFCSHLPLGSLAVSIGTLSPDKETAICYLCYISVRIMFRGLVPAVTIDMGLIRLPLMRNTGRWWLDG